MNTFQLTPTIEVELCQDTDTSMTVNKRIHVAVGVIINSAGEVLIGQRTVQDAYFEQWEFPGGKVEPGETAQDALTRELQEELGIEVLLATPMICVSYDYPDRKVDLDVFLVSKYSGEPKGQENQALNWLPSSQLENVNFLSGNKKIISAVQELKLES